MSHQKYNLYYGLHFSLHLFDYSRMGKKIQIAIMIITLGIFLVPTSVFAHIDLTHHSENSCCSDSAEHSNSDCCKNHKSKDKQEKDCDGSCGNFACHAPSTTTLFINYPSTSEDTNAVAIASFNNLWNYTKKQPRPVYFQIWSPPELS